MRVLLEATAGAREHPSGIGRYVHELITALGQTRPAPDLTLGVRIKKYRDRRFLPRPPGVSCRLIDARLEGLLLRGFDLFHGTDARIPRTRKLARVVTLHDLFSLERDDLARQSFRDKKRERYRNIAAEADRIVCVSQATRDSFVQAFPDAQSRTCVVHHGVSQEFSPRSAEAVTVLRTQLDLHAPFLLFVGLLNSRKNLVTLLQAFERLANSHDELQLVLAGKPSHDYGEIEQALESMQFRARVRLLGFVDREQLPALLTAAERLVFPSLAEGFGLPVLEAYACGTAVVASDLAVLREVGGSLLEVAADNTAEAWEEALQRSLDRPMTDERRRALLQHAGRYTWKKTAEQTLEAYAEAASERRSRS